MRLLLALPLIAMTPLLAAGKEELKWSELSTLSGRTVRITVPKGATIAGKLTTIEPDGLVLQVEKTTDRAAYPKGRFVVPRSEVKVLGVLSKTKRWRVVGTICGAWVGLGFGGYAAIHTSSGGTALATLAAVGGGLTTIGYLLGDAGDHRVSIITIRD